MAENFYQLQPEFIMNCLERAGFRPTGEYSQLNSYENRVFDIRLETGEELAPPLSSLAGRVIAKFYRPGRWSREAILDEHDFLRDLHREGIDAVCPLVQSSELTLSEHEGIFLAVFPFVGGRNPQEFLAGELKQVGRTLARIHNVGARRPALHRLQLTPDSMGWPALEVLDPVVAPEVHGRYFEAAEQILESLAEQLEGCSFLRIHGDCHKGNLLARDERFHFVDFDDFLNGPAAQDLWMLAGGRSTEDQQDYQQLREGYAELRELDPHEENLFELLRGLRIIHYAAWIQRRWSDPSFPRLFPQFGTYSYWAEEAEALESIVWATFDRD